MGSREALREQWKNHVASWEASGKSSWQWAKDNNLSYHSLLYWRLKYARKEPILQKTFVELQDPPPDGSGISLEVAGVTVRIDQSFDPATLTACIQLLRGL